MKTIIYTAVLVLISMGLSAQTDEDFSVSSNAIRINYIGAKTLAEINKVAEKETKIIQLDKSLTQEEFDRICSRLKWIKKLQADANPNIQNLISVGNLLSLESIRIRSASLSQQTPIDISPISKITSIKEIDFQNTKITNEDLLSSLINLEKINLQNSDIASITFLQSTPNVRELNIQGSNHTFADYAPLALLKKLRNIDIQGNTQANNDNLKVLLEHKELRSVNISECDKITSLHFISNSEKLQDLYANNCKNIQNFGGIQNAVLLRRVHLSGCVLENLSILANKSEIRELNLSNAQISSLQGIAGCQNLERLDLSNSTITSVSELSTLTKIRRLSLAHTKISDISSLSSLIDMTELDISGTLIEQITPLSSCKKLSIINLSSTKISDIRPIYTVDKISSLQVSSRVPQAQLEAIKIRFPLIRIDIIE